MLCFKRYNRHYLKMKITILVAILSFLFVSIDGEKDLDDMLSLIFNRPSNITTTTAASTEDENPQAPNESKDCKCVPYYLCDANTATDGIIDIQGAGDCESYLDVLCCKTPDKVEKFSSEKKQGCGHRNVNGVGFRITSDKSDETQYGEFPWMVGVLAEKVDANTGRKLNVYQCGGALIHPQVILTAAHCVASQEEKYKVRAGEWDTQTTKELYPHQDRFVKNVVIHKGFSPTTLFNDVALLFLESSVEIVENVNTLCLPEQDVEVKGGVRCFSSGWGKESPYSAILKKIDIPIVDHDTCQNRLRDIRGDKQFELDNSFVCAGGEERKDTCKGAGGDPLMCPIPGQPNRYQQIGIVAWGISCNESQIPGTYVNVGLFRHWVDEQMSLQKFDSSYYKP